MKSLLDTLRKLGMARVAMLGGVTLGILGAFIWLELNGPAASRMTTLTAGLDSVSEAQLTAALAAQQIPYTTHGGKVLVPTEDLATARTVLARNGLSGAGTGGDGTVGYEIFDHGDDFATTAFDQRIKLTRALEGELARTIVSVRGILHARVHLVLPRRDPFSHDQEHAQASVMLSVAGGRTLSPEAVQSIVDLVAAGVPGLRPQDVTVVDSNLHLLEAAGAADDPRTLAAREAEIRRRTEERLAQGVELLLERTLGPGHVRAEASVQMNFDKTKEQQVKYNPDGQVVRSTQTVQVKNKTTDKTQSAGAKNNLPNANAGGNTTGSQQGRDEETTNYEISKTVRNIVHDQPQIERISLAVMVDEKAVKGANGKVTYQPRSKAELDRIAALVKSAVGFDAKRGDQIDVVSMPFVNPIQTSEAAPPTRAPGGNADLVMFIRTVALGVVGFGIIILTARSILASLKPMAAGLGLTDRPVGELAGPGSAGGALGGGGLAGAGHTGAVLAGAGGGSRGGVTGPPGEAAALAGPGASGENAETITVSNIEGQMRASSIRTVTQLVERHPDTTLGIIRGWIATDQG